MFKKLKKRIKNQKGFTLIETILTSIIIGVGLMGGMVVMQNATANTVNNDLSTIATQLANQKIEQMIADSKFIGYETLISDNYPNEVVTDIYNMLRKVIIAEVSSVDLSVVEPGSGLKSVSATVSWGTKDYQTVTVTTLIADYD